MSVDPDGRALEEQNARDARRRFRFRVTALLLIMTLVAVALFFFTRPVPIAVTGMVTIDGKPLRTGTIEFVMNSLKSDFRLRRPIRNGNYSFSKKDGMRPGRYTIEVRATRDGAIPLDKLPSKYNDVSELEIELKPGSTNFDLALVSR